MRGSERTNVFGLLQPTAQGLADVAGRVSYGARQGGGDWLDRFDRFDRFDRWDRLDRFDDLIDWIGVGTAFGPRPSAFFSIIFSGRSRFWCRGWFLRCR